jgi:hypothetical protein
MRPRPRDSPSVSPVKGGSAIAQAGTDTARRLSGLQGGDSPDSQRATRQVAFPLAGWVITAFWISCYTISDSVWLLFRRAEPLLSGTQNGT